MNPLLEYDFQIHRSEVQDLDVGVTILESLDIVQQYAAAHLIERLVVEDMDL